MQRILIGAALLVCLAHPAIAQDVIGDWQGTLKVGSVELRLVLHIGRESSGALKATLGHRPFLVLADYLMRKGSAVLRYDKRGVGRSGGNYAAATTSDFAFDAEAAFSYLRARPEVDPRKVGLIGHSEGGVIAPIVAAHHLLRSRFGLLLCWPTMAESAEANY